MKCKVETCDKNIWREEEPRKSKYLCKEHALNGMIVKCSICEVEMKSRPDRYLNHINNNIPFICRPCSAKINGKDNFKKFIGSEKQKEHLKKLNSDPEFIKKNINRLKKCWDDEEFRKMQKDKLIEWHKSDNGKEHNKKLLEYVHAKRKNEFNEKLNYYLKLNNLKLEDIHCEDCGKLMKINDKYSLLNILKNEKPILCHYCSSSRIGKQFGSENFKKWINSEKGREHILELGRKYNYTYKENFKDWIGSEKQKEHLRKISFFSKYKTAQNFYESKCELIKFESIDYDLKYEDIVNLEGISGVWAKFTSNGLCLDVSQTQNIGKEMKWSLRVLDSNKNKTDEEIENMNRKSLRKKYKNMYNDANGNIIFKIIAINIKDKETREAIEMQYAHDNKAKYWNPAPGQLIK